MSSVAEKKAVTRLYAVQALFQMEASDATADRVIAEFLGSRFGATIDEMELRDGDPKLFRKIIEKTVERQALIDQMTDRALVAKWPIARIDPTLRAIFRAAGAELILQDAPPKVIISQYIDVVSSFFDVGDELRFTNAVLDHMAREAQPENF